MAAQPLVLPSYEDPKETFEVNSQWNFKYFRNYQKILKLNHL